MDPSQTGLLSSRFGNVCAERRVRIMVRVVSSVSSLGIYGVVCNIKASHSLLVSISCLLFLLNISDILVRLFPNIPPTLIRSMCCFALYLNFHRLLSSYAPIEQEIGVYH